MLREMQIVKTVLTKFQMEMKTLLGIGLLHSGKVHVSILPVPHDFVGG
jgi:hypothetical protein